MIYRQDLERMRDIREAQKQETFARIAYVEGKIAQAAEEEKPALQEEREKLLRLALVTHGALEECKYYLAELDLEEPSQELTDPLRQIPL